jgi:hypothetical protein
VSRWFGALCATTYATTDVCTGERGVSLLGAVSEPRVRAVAPVGARAQRGQGMAVQVHPIKPVLKAPGIMRLKLQ